MAARAPLKLAGCTTCRASVLRSFIASAAPLVSIRAPAHPAGLRAPSAPQCRLSSTLGPQPAPREKEDEVPELEESGAADGGAAGSGNTGAEASDVPWYLQEEAPRHPTLVHEPAPIPEVPEDSPRLLEPLLKFVADDMGLDDLNLLDLRALDPPPALGPKLLMLFGTARSERHLHVSAGSLVRWLRARGIHADADGLLGPNELKIRLRRKARKAKLLGNTGAAPSADDGISTRWICVNLGTLGWTDAEAEVQGDDGRFSGFGSPRIGTTVVVQLFTEAKRKELDLETLWDRLLQRQLKAEAAEAGAGHQSPLPLPSNGSGARGLSAGQQRLFSTLPRRRARAMDSTDSLPDATDTAPQVTETSLSDQELPSVDQMLALGVPGRISALEDLKRHLVTQPRALRLETLRLRDGPSPYVQVWTAGLSGLPSSLTWWFRLWLYMRGRRASHPDYNLDGLRDLVREMELSCIHPERDQYMDMLEIIYQPPGDPEETLSSQSELAVDLLDIMYERGGAVIANDVIVSAIDSISKVDVSGPEADRLLSTLEGLLAQARLPYLGETLLMRLLNAYAREGRWDRFWAAWRLPPRYQVARSPTMYAYMFRRVAGTHHRARCTDALRGCLQEMLNEDPPVPLQGDVLRAVRACVRVADPAAQRLERRLAELWDRLDEVEKGASLAREFVKVLRMLRWSESENAGGPQ